ncbi:MAG: hypothetical protein AB7O47_08065 [Flavobacteriales bacterium]
MNKKKLIAVAIVAFLLLVPFQAAYISFDTSSQLLQVLSMTLVIIGAVYAVFLYNKGAEESGEHH